MEEEIVDPSISVVRLLEERNPLPKSFGGAGMETVLVLMAEMEDLTVAEVFPLIEPELIDGFSGAHSFIPSNSKAGPICR